MWSLAFWKFLPALLEEISKSSQFSLNFKDKRELEKYGCYICQFNSLMRLIVLEVQMFSKRVGWNFRSKAQWATSEGVFECVDTILSLISFQSKHTTMAVWIIDPTQESSCDAILKPFGSVLRHTKGLNVRFDFFLFLLWLTTNSSSYTTGESKAQKWQDLRTFFFFLKPGPDWGCEPLGKKTKVEIS